MGCVCYETHGLGLGRVVGMAWGTHWVHSSASRTGAGTGMQCLQGWKQGIATADAGQMPV